MNIVQANKYFREGRFDDANKIYCELFSSHPELYKLIKINHEIAQKRKNRSSKYSINEYHDIKLNSYIKKVIKRGADGDYGEWIANEPISKLKKIHTQNTINYATPKYSVLLPVYKVKNEFLLAAIYSVIAQTYTNWELCIAMADCSNDENVKLINELKLYDKRIKVTFLSENGGISINTNEAYKISSGDYICLLDHDDELSLDALASIDSLIFNNDYDFIYTDKDCLLEDGSKRVNPLFKPKYSPEILFSANYLTHFNVFSRDVLDVVGLWDSNTDGAQDWDIFWRVVDSTKKILHIPQICYHWRIHHNSTSTGLESKPYVTNSQINTITKHLLRNNLNADVLKDAHGGYKINWKRTCDKKFEVACILHSEVIQNFDISKNRFILISSELSGYKFSIFDSTSTNLTAKLIGLPKNTYDAILCIDADIENYSDSDIVENISWVINSKEIAFCSSILLDEKKNIIAAGVVFTDDMTPINLFKGSHIYDYGIFGSMLWYRNWRAVSPFFCAFKGNIDFPDFSANSDANYLDIFASFCLSIFNCGFRGLTSPHSQLTVSNININANTDDLGDMSFSYEPYFNLNLVATFIPHLKNDVGSDNLKKVEINSIAIDKYSSDAIELSKYFDCTQLDIDNNNCKNINYGFNPLGVRVINWHMPGFASIYYGGIMTILRLSSYLYKSHGVISYFIIHDRIDSYKLSIQIKKEFSFLNFKVSTIFDYESLDLIPDSDYSVATLWTTAYTVLKINNTRIKVYMIQDWEPLFYPAGSTMAQVELTYKFGFYSIANTISLKNLYDKYAPNKSVVLSPAVDTNLFYPPLENIKNSNFPKKLFYYARPGTPRNCFEIAINSLKMVKLKLGDKVDIVCAGSNWSPSDFGLENMITYLGMLPFEDTAKLYRTVHVGLALMMTKHPSYLPFELMASGVLVVSLKNEANDWLLKDGVNCLLAEASVSCLANRLIDAVVNFETFQEIIDNGVDLINNHHSSWDSSFKAVSDFLEVIY